MAHQASVRTPDFLRIGVNSRFILEKGTGVPNYIISLFKKCLETDRRNEYVFLQPHDSRTLGQTLTAPTRPGMAGAALFDSLRVRKLIKAANVNVFHAPAHILPLGRISGVKYVLTIHDLATRVLPEQYGLLHRWYYRIQLPRSLRLADAIIADSHSTKNDIMRFYRIPENRIHVVHLGVADYIQQAMQNPGKRLIAEKYFFSVATHPKRKNVLGTLTAFAAIAGRSDVKFVIAGVIGEQQRQELLAHAAQLGLTERIVLFGYADDQQLVNLYRFAECLTYASFYEGFGFPVVEAMACGCPVITSRISSMPEIVPDTDWLVDPYNTPEITRKMEKILALSPSDRQQLISRNQQHAKSFTWERAARQTINVFEQVTR
ncbi:MAG TPA: glycosyltransferase family 1 protein [Candidatus Paceibacterota bacterium]|nr:glycosyltransferase family 1 protein [Candidatus Paceibacterota bacterium]